MQKRIVKRKKKRRKDLAYLRAGSRLGRSYCGGKDGGVLAMVWFPCGFLSLLRVSFSLWIFIF
jgi:hypothetical protein